MTSTSISNSFQDESDSNFPPLSKADVIACAFSSWHPTFRRHSPKSTIIRALSNDFIQYLGTDGVFLPEGSGPMGISELSDSDDDDDGASANGTTSSDDQSWQFSFPDLDREIREVIHKYDGAVFPKLNWSSPRDAAWMIPGQNLKCQSPADVYLLLKSSDFITHDLDHAFDLCYDHTSTDSSLVAPEDLEKDVTNREEEEEGEKEESSTRGRERTNRDEVNEGEESIDGEKKRSPDSNSTSQPVYPFELVLKKWYDIPRSQEWRCFVREKQLIAITQRDSNYYEFLQPKDVGQGLVEQIVDFFETEITNRFPSNSYVFDLYLTRTGDRFFIVDFNPYSPTTDPLLFTWSELNQLPNESSSSTSSPEFRIVTLSTMTTHTQALPAFSHNRYPKDVVELSDGASIEHFAKEWAEKLEIGVVETLKEKTVDKSRTKGGKDEGQGSEGELVGR